MEMFPGICTVCGRRFLDDEQLRALSEKVTGRRRLDHLLRYCPECRQKGAGLVER